MRACPECRQGVEDNTHFCPFCGAAVAPEEAPDPFIGTTVNGKFRVEALLGQGGMGRVYRARHLTLDRPVVLKMLHQAYSDDPQIVQRFQREARASSKLNHPNSIAVLDFGNAEDGTLFMAMEFIGGRDLAKLIQEDFPLPAARTAKIGAQILSALAEAHAQGVIHRDLKPENVMVEPRRDEPDHVKVLDFGIAKIISPGAGEPKLTRAGLVCGTPEYMSPEQAKGADLDARSDLYSVGVILYQMVTGDLPFTSDTPVGYLTAHLSEPVIAPRQKRPDLSIPPDLDALIVKAMEKDPASRFQSADEMRTALLVAARGSQKSPLTSTRLDLPTSRLGAARGPNAETLVTPKRRRPALALGVLAFVVLGALGGLAITLMARKEVADRKGHPDTVSPAKREAVAVPAPPSVPLPAVATEPEGVKPEFDSPKPGANTIPAAQTGSLGAPASPPAPVPEPKAVSHRSNRGKARALYDRAEKKRANLDADGAIKLYLAAEAADPDLSEIQKRLAVCYQLKGETRKAAERYRKYLATDPPDAERIRAILPTLK